MVELLKEIEAVPAVLPAVTPRWMVEQAPEDEDPGSAQVWQRIEEYTRTRYTSRAVEWTIEAGEGEEWVPPLAPVISFTAEKWESGAWVSTTLTEGPLGYCIPSDGVFRILAEVGGGDVPPAVSEAFRRLHEYSRGIAEQFKEDAAIHAGEDMQRAMNWAARAIQLSGAADALRPYRRQK